MCAAFTSLSRDTQKFVRQFKTSCPIVDEFSVHNKEGLTFVTPRVSPAPGRAKKSPTTAELYRTLGLVPLSERES